METKTLSKQGYAIIEKWEQFRAWPYKDPGGVWTIGFGHTRTASAQSGPITIAQAITLLKQDVRVTEQYVNAMFPNLRQCQFDALVSLLYNIGFGKFSKYKLYKLLKQDPDSKDIADEWIEFRNQGGKYLRGLMRRRIDELALYYSW